MVSEALGLRPNPTIFPPYKSKGAEGQRTDTYSSLHQTRCSIIYLRVSLSCLIAVLSTSVGLAVSIPLETRIISLSLRTRTWKPQNISSQDMSHLTTAHSSFTLLPSFKLAETSLSFKSSSFIPPSSERNQVSQPTVSLCRAPLNHSNMSLQLTERCVSYLEPFVFFAYGLYCSHQPLVPIFPTNPLTLL